MAFLIRSIYHLGEEILQEFFAKKMNFFNNSLIIKIFI